MLLRQHPQASQGHAGVRVSPFVQSAAPRGSEVRGRLSSVSVSKTLKMAQFALGKTGDQEG